MLALDRVRARNLVSLALKSIERGKRERLRRCLGVLVKLSERNNALMRTDRDQAAIDASIVRVLGAALSDRTWKFEFKRHRRGNPATYEPELKAIRHLETEIRHARILHKVFALEAEKLGKGIERLRRGEKMSDRALFDRDNTYRHVAQNSSMDWKTVRRLSQKARRARPKNTDVVETASVAVARKSEANRKRNSPN
jgi:hypothetical protein